MNRITRFISRATICCWMFTGDIHANAQSTDTLRITLPEAESIFLRNNLQILAEELNISQADAKILQASAWPNPTISVSEIQLWTTPGTDPSPPFFGNFWRNRTVGAQLEQLIQTAGKRRKNINLEARNKMQAENTLADMLLTLKTEFRQTWAELLYLQDIKGDQIFQQKELEKLIAAQERQLESGSISKTELFRLKALRLSLLSELKSREEAISENQTLLKSLMAIAPETYLVLEADDSDSRFETLKQQHTATLLPLVLKNNTIIRHAGIDIQVREAQLNIEKANRVPDLNLNMGYDRNGNNQLDFVGLGVSIDLPVFNKNKGNLAYAMLEVRKSKLLEEQTIQATTGRFLQTWNDLQNALQLFEAIDPGYIEEISQLTIAVAANFRNRNMSLLEFLDYFDSFRESKQQYYEAIKNVRIKQEELNYLIGGDLSQLLP